MLSVLFSSIYYSGPQISLINFIHIGLQQLVVLMLETFKSKSLGCYRSKDQDQFLPEKQQYLPSWTINYILLCFSLFCLKLLMKESGFMCYFLSSSLGREANYFYSFRKSFWLGGLLKNLHCWHWDWKLLQQTSKLKLENKTSWQKQFSNLYIVKYIVQVNVPNTNIF